MCLYYAFEEPLGEAVVTRKGWEHFAFYQAGGSRPRADVIRAIPTAHRMSGSRGNEDVMS